MNPPPTAKPLLTVTELDKNYGATNVLRAISFEIAMGETLVILGESGCGKTTLLRILSGAQEPNAGQVRMGARSLSGVKVRERGIVYLDQEALLFEHLDVFENVAFALRLTKTPEAEVQRQVAEMLRAVELEEHASKRSWQLSGGQKQRVAFARAILARPQVLLLDEPFSSLDGRSRATMQELFRDLRRKYAMTCLFVTHDVKEALVVGDRFAYMAAGSLRIHADRQAFLHDEATGILREISFWQGTSEQLQ